MDVPSCLWESLSVPVNKDLSSATSAFVSVYLKTKQKVRKIFYILFSTKFLKNILPHVCDSVCLSVWYMKQQNYFSAILITSNNRHQQVKRA